MSSNLQKTSAAGEAFLERHEADVLKAYRCPAGIWTISKGLTKASGVIAPKAGMVITREESQRLTRLALGKNYEPAVRKAMPAAKQHEFDGAVSFHWNTGAIGRASWVAKWRAGDWAAVKAKIKLWNKGGGRVLPGLVRRREEEFRLIQDGIYASVPAPTRKSGMAQIVVPLSAKEIGALREALTQLGYEPGPRGDGVAESCVRAFQRDHDLTIDGIIGKATLSTVQRMLDARSKSKVSVPAAGAAAGGAALPSIDALPVDPSAVGMTGGVAWLAWFAWSYRDAIAAMIQDKHPEIANWLRSR